MKKHALCLACLALILGGCGSSGVKLTYQKGMAALEAGEYETAVSSMDEAIQEEYRLPEAYRAKGVASLKLGDYPSAIAALQRSLNALDISNESFERDTLYYLAEARNAYGEPAKALEVYGEILSRKEEWQAYYLRGETYFKLGQYDAAAEDFNSAIENSENYDLYFQIYELYAGSNRENDGTAYLQKALEISDSTGEGYYNRGRVYYYLKEYEKAEKELVEAMNQDCPEAVLLLGKVYLVKKDTDSARSMYQQALQKEEQKAQAYNGLALCDIAEENYDSALDNIQKGLDQEDGDKQPLLFNEIVVYEHKLDFATAKEKMEAYLALYPDDEAAQREAQFLESR